MLMGPMRMLGMALGMAQRAVASGNRLFEILDRDAADHEPAGRAASCRRAPARSASSGVGLRYGAGPPALTGIDLEVKAGRTVALVGPTGSGKTSLVALIARLYDPSEGSVSVDGADLREVDVSSLRRQIAFVADDPFLFSDSVAENIAYARPEATREQIELAAQRAQAHDFILGLPDGYETVVGERGLTLSGGQRQRVAIARALIAEPRILILDDATSSVDATTEEAIKRGLREAMEGRTTFVVAHRLSTISLADEIVVMEAGRIVDRGHATRSCSSAARCTPRSPSSAARTCSSCSATSRSARRWRGCERRAKRSEIDEKRSEVDDRDRGPGEPARPARGHAAACSATSGG